MLSLLSAADKPPKANPATHTIVMISKATRPPLQRAVSFVFIAVIYSGLIGPRIIGSGILYRYHFDIYGGLGKALLFGIIAFGLLITRHGSLPSFVAWKKCMALWLVLSLLLFVGAWLGVSQLQNGNGDTLWTIITHGLLLASLLTAAIGCFGLSNLRLLFRSYKRDVLIAAALAAAFYVFLLVVYTSWRLLATIVLHAVQWLLHLSGQTAVFVPPRTLLLSKFGIDIAQYCSGIESIALFTGLYAVVGVLDWHRFNHLRFLALFPAALLLLFGLNILRVYGLIMAGYYINPHIAFSLFHTYAGMVFFIVYAALFFGVSYKWMLRKT